MGVLGLIVAGMHDYTFIYNIFKLMNLEALAAKYGTDKLQHGYIPFYEKHLPKNPKRILEIGVKEGRSLAMWHEYFPNADIYGIDLFAECSHEDVYKNIDHYSNGEWELGKVFLLTGNQCDWQILEELRKYDFDVIIDDGSHNSRDQLMTFFGLFNGKHYFIEDLQCNDEDFYSQGLPLAFSAKSIFGEMSGNDLDSFHTGRGISLNNENKIVCITSNVNL